MYYNNIEIQPNYDGLIGVPKENRSYSVDLTNSSLFGQKSNLRRESISTNISSQKESLLKIKAINFMSKILVTARLAKRVADFKSSI